VNEKYVYDESGARIRKTAGGVNTDYPFPYYERTGSSAVTKHYSFGGVPVAVPSSSLFLLYQDGVQRAAACATFCIAFCAAGGCARPKAHRPGR
jgi:hypothetical protein